MNREELRDFATNAQAMITAGAVEDRLRHYLSSRLNDIFPDHPWWVQAHMQGIEEHVHFATAHGNRDGFVDAVVGKTAIEYEKNLTIQRIFDEGYYQVKEYCAALYNIGIPEGEIFGVLSDTVRWYGYSIRLVRDVEEGRLLGPDQVELVQVTYIDLSTGTEEIYTQFEVFVSQFMGRDESRILNANTLVTDFGIDSSFYSENIVAFSDMVTWAIDEKPDYAELINQVWQNFIAYLGVSEYGEFSNETYIREFYLVTVSKILCVNILAGHAVISSDEELISILKGDYFYQQNIFNFVDYDYFGWLNRSPFVDRIIPSVRNMQSRLRAYDFSRVGEQDIFGKLLAQLADREHRLMLGQEFTPHWVAKEIVDYNIQQLRDETPRIMDMCCGSGVFLIEAIKAVREKYHIFADNYDAEKDEIAFSCVMGFDIDPLAVMLAKVNWIMAMRDLFPVHAESITVPIYHADSLFVATPITHRMPDEGESFYTLELNDREIRLPSFLLSSDNRNVFDAFVSKTYHLAMVRAEHTVAAAGGINADSLIDAIVAESGVQLNEEEKGLLGEASLQLVSQLEALQRQGRNGIWHFILSNSYRPGLTEHHYNCIVSNPPWMAMSKLADNPYKAALRDIARKYSIQPLGASHPHMELATIFLVSSIDRYLCDGARWSCIMPVSLLSGLNHEQFRKEQFRHAEARLNAGVTSIWELPSNTFKNKAVVLSGQKSDVRIEPPIDGRVYTDCRVYESCEYTLNRQGNRSAWTNRGNDAEVIDLINENPVKFKQGCDLFPRTALFHQFTRRTNGNWDIAPIERTSDLWYLINDSKKAICNELSANNVDNQYVFDAFISKHLSPFIMSSPAKVLIPGKKINNNWVPITDAELALMNASTSYVFREISGAVGENLVPYLVSTINIYGKLYHQRFEENEWMVLSSASGANPCATYIKLDDFDSERLVIDQTLYWFVTDSEEEATFITGLLNSTVLAESISDFQPEGGFGKRHIHSLPYKIIPSFNPEDETHLEVVSATRELISEWRTICENDDIFEATLNPNKGTLNSRRRKQQGKIKTLESFERYDLACSSVLR
ncbi:MAG: N-6 DNA methylase [Ruminococcus sp.]|nr:N-6 DNA methylase [Ruminococcus sp.]